MINLIWFFRFAVFVYNRLKSLGLHYDSVFREWQCDRHKK